MGDLRKFGWALLLVSLLGASALAPAAAAPSAACQKAGQKGNVVIRPRGWASIRGPEFPAADDSVTEPTPRTELLEADPHNPSHLYAANGTIVMKTIDGGCEWKKVFALPLAPEDPSGHSQQSRITSIVVPESKNGRSFVYVTLGKPGYANPGRSFVVRSEDSGKTWQRADSGLPPTARILNFRVAPSNHKVLYASFTFSTGVDPLVLYRSGDAGRSWSPASDAAAEAASETTTRATALMIGGASNFLVDPADPDALWAWDPTKVRHSTDAGKTWKKVVFPGDQPGAYLVDVFRRPGQPARILIVNSALDRTATSSEVFRSDNGGKTWATILSPGVVWAAAQGKTADSLVVSTRGAVSASGTPHKVFRFDGRLWRKGRFPWNDITPQNMPQQGLSIEVSRGSRSVYFIPNYTSIERYSGPS